MAEDRKPTESALLSDQDTTTPDQDSNNGNQLRSRKKSRTKRLRKRNAILPGQNASSKKVPGLRLQPIETVRLRGSGTKGFSSKRNRTFGTNEGKMAGVTFVTGADAQEFIGGNITITSSYPCLREAAIMTGHSSDQKSSQKTQSTSLTSLSSTSPRLTETEKRMRSQSARSTPLPPKRTYSEDVFADSPLPLPGRLPSARGYKRTAFWWEAYNARLVKPMSTCLLVHEDPERCVTSAHTQIIDHFIERYRTISFSNTKADAPLNDTQVDLEFIAKCLDDGVDIDQVDGAGQTILMEAVRSWHLDVIKYLLMNEASIIKQDYHGRTPIHVAAAANRPAVVHLLLDKGANPNSKVKYSGETPLHIAARRGALLSVEALLERDAYLEARDYKGRTPFHLAAEFGKCDMIDFLLKGGANPANIDDDGISCLVYVIIKCPNRVDKAFDSLVQQSDESEKPLYDPAFFETCPEDWKTKVKTNLLLDVIESQESAQAIRHTIIQTMIKTRWSLFGRLWAIVNFFFRFLFFAAWTAWILIIRWEDKHIYDWGIHWWRGILPALGVFFLAWEIKIEALELWYSIKRGVMMAQIQLDSIQTDLKYVIHPRWKDEETYLLKQEKDRQMHTRWYRQLWLYGRDLWNTFDLIIFLVIILCMITHIADVVNHDIQRARIHGQLGSVTIILLGIRLMKEIRGFFWPGQLVIMLGLMAADFARFIFLYLQLYIPFTIAFWIIFGGARYPYHEVCQLNCTATANCTTSSCNWTSHISNRCDINLENCVSNRSTVTVAGMESYDRLCFSLFRLTLVDEYDMDAMVTIDPYMSFVLVSAFLLTSAVVGINFLIGLISNGLGDGAREHVEVKSLLQKLRAILLIEQATYLCGPRPDKIVNKLSKDQHELDHITVFECDNTFSIRQHQEEVARSLNKLKKMLSGVVKQQQELLVNNMKLEQFILDQRAVPQTQGSNIGSTLDTVDGDDYMGLIPDVRPKSRAMKLRSGLDLSMSYSLRARDIDAEHEFQLTRKGPGSLRYKSTSDSKSPKIDVSN